jgi:hypothetical protein
MTTNRCEGYLPQVRVAAYRFERVPCRQWRGLRSFLDAEGVTHYACPALGHMADVVRRFGIRVAPETESEIAYANGHR